MRALSIVMLILLIGYVVADQTGGIETFNNAINERDGWKKIGNLGYSKTQIRSIQHVNITILKDPELTDSCQILQGAIKKSALDRMTLIEQHSIEIKEDEVLQDHLQQFCYKKGNTVIIDSYWTSKEIETQGFGIGGSPYPIQQQ